MKVDKNGNVTYTAKEIRRKMKSVAKKLGHKSVKAALEYMDKNDPSELGYAQLNSYRFLLGEDPGMKAERKERRERERVRKEEWRKIKDRICDKSIVPAACQNEKCSMCGAQANKKVEEVLFEDDPTAFAVTNDILDTKIRLRHNFTAYVCILCFKDIMKIRNK